MREDWIFVGFLSIVGAMLLCLLGMMVFAGIMEVSCYHSGDPDSMPCFIMHGKAQKMDVKFK